MTDESEFLQFVVEKLEECGIPYMLTGSFVLAAHGDPRSTNDADFVVDAWQRKSMFNIIHSGTALKADIMIKKDRTFSETEFERRERIKLFGRHVMAVTPEDCILSKLEWAKAGESERQLRDVAGVIKLQAKTLDWDYIDKWARELTVDAQLEEARALAGFPA